MRVPDTGNTQQRIAAAFVVVVAIVVFLSLHYYFNYVCKVLGVRQLSFSCIFQGRGGSFKNSLSPLKYNLITGIRASRYFFEYTKCFQVH